MQGLTTAAPKPKADADADADADDEEVPRRLTKAMRSVPRLAAARIDATVADGVGTSGLASDDEAERAAEIAVEHVPR